MAQTLKQWLEANPVPEKMLWRGAAENQFHFVHNPLLGVAGAGLPCDTPEDIENFYAVCKVIGTHRSKSITLPVYSLERPDVGVRFVMRDNFYNWKVSVVSEKPIQVDLTGLCYTAPPREPDYTGDHLHPVYCEGFPSDLVFGYYEQNQARWTMELYGEMSVFTAVFLVMRALGAIKPLVYRTKAEHDAELAARAARRKS